MKKNASVKIRENGCEYYLKRKIGDFTIHLIQLHFPDQPNNTKLAFKKDSKQFMVSTLKSIQKTKFDIIIVAAHSHNGFWDNELSDKELSILMKKADLVLSATTHFFKRKIVKKQKNNGPLFLNTGSITYPASYCPFGFIQVNVLKNPNMIVLQYINAAKMKMRFPGKKYTFVKLINGKIFNIKISELGNLIDSLRNSYNKNKTVQN
jgi:predicted phosphodiesterase